MPKVNINPTINKAMRRYLMRSDSVMYSPFLWRFSSPNALQRRAPRSLDESGTTEKRFSKNCDLMRVKTSPLFELAHVLVRLNHVASWIVNANHGLCVLGENLHEN